MDKNGIRYWREEVRISTCRQIWQGSQGYLWTLSIKNFAAGSKLVLASNLDQSTFLL